MLTQCKSNLDAAIPIHVTRTVNSLMSCCYVTLTSAIIRVNQTLVCAINVASTLSCIVYSTLIFTACMSAMYIFKRPNFAILCAIANEYDCLVC